MSFLLVKILFLLALAAAFGAWAGRWYMRRGLRTSPRNTPD